MVHLIILDAAGTSQRRLLQEERQKLEKKGYSPGGSGGEERSWEDLFGAGSTRGLFYDKTYMVLEGAERLGKFPESLQTSLEKEPGNTVFIALYNKSWSAFYSGAAKKNVAFRKGELFPRWGNERIEWLRKKASIQGVMITPEGLAFLSERFEDGEEVRGELAKLALAFKGTPLSRDQVMALSMDEGEKDLFRFLDAFCYGNIPETLETFRKLSLKHPFLYVLTALYNRVRPAMYMGLYPSGREREEVLKTLGVRSYQKRMGREILRGYPSEAVYDLMACLAGLSVAEKSGKGLGWKGLEMGLLKFLGAFRGTPERP